MSNLLSTAKQVLIEGAMQTFDTFREGLPLERSAYVEHFKALGSIIYTIDSTQSLSELILRLELGGFERIGYFKEDDKMLSNFLKVVNESR
jgi:hypothetical protein